MPSPTYSTPCKFFLFWLQVVSVSAVFDHSARIQRVCVSLLQTGSGQWWKGTLLLLTRWLSLLRLSAKAFSGVAAAQCLAAKAAAHTTLLPAAQPKQGRRRDANMGLHVFM